MLQRKYLFCLTCHLIWPTFHLPGDTEDQFFPFPQVQPLTMWPSDDPGFSSSPNSPYHLFSSVVGHPLHNSTISFQPASWQIVNVALRHCSSTFWLTACPSGCLSIWLLWCFHSRNSNDPPSQEELFLWLFWEL